MSRAILCCLSGDGNLTASLTSNGRPLFSILSGSDGLLDFAELSHESWRSYAARHGYHFTEAFLSPENENLGHPSWQKLWWIEQAITAKRASDPGTWLCWVDADTVVTNRRLPLEDFVRMHAATWLIVSKDWSDGDSPWSAGVMLIRACAEAGMFFWEAQRRVEYMRTACWDQSAMQAVFRDRPELRGGLRVVQRRLLQSVPARDGVVDPWKPGDFVCHATGLENRDKRAILEAHLKLAVC